jgi:hypothetical protein
VFWLVLFILLSVLAPRRLENSAGVARMPFVALF